MSDDGETKDDVKVPDGEVGDRIKKLFQEEEKDTSEFIYDSGIDIGSNTFIYRRCCPYLHG